MFQYFGAGDRASQRAPPPPPGRRGRDRDWDWDRDWDRDRAGSSPRPAPVVVVPRGEGSARRSIRNNLVRKTEPENVRGVCVYVSCRNTEKNLCHFPLNEECNAFL